MARTAAEAVDAIETKVRDATNRVFAAPDVADALAVGVRVCFPSVYQVRYEDLGTVLEGATEVDLTGHLSGADRLYAIEYKAGAWRILPFRVSGDTAYLAAPLYRERKMRGLVVAPYPVPVAPATFDMPDEAVDVAIDLAVAELLDGYAAGRIQYDKYTATSMDDAVAPYEVQNVSKQIREQAMARLGEIGHALPVGVV